MNYKYHNELKKLSDAYPLTDAERKELKKLLIDKGQILPILIWDGYVVDGHNRLELLNELNIEPFYKEVAFESLDDAKMFIINNYLGQRNLTDGQKWELAQDKKEILLEKGREKQSPGINQHTDRSLSTIDKEQKHNTQNEIAKDLGWSTGKVAMADKVWKEAAPEVKEKIKAGETSINQAYQEIRKVEKQKKLVDKKEENKKQEKLSIVTKPKVFIQSYKDFLPNKKDFDLLLTDPPYSTDIDDIEGFVNHWLPLALDTLKDDARGYICIGAYPSEIKAYLDFFAKQDRFILDNPLIWTYRNTLGITPKRRYNLNYQMILHFYSEASDDLDTSITNEIFSVQDINAPDGRQGDRYHKWQKPNELARRMIKHSTKEGDRIIDPFVGSGTFLVNAGKMNRYSVGCDIDTEIIELLKERGCDVQ